MGAGQEPVPQNGASVKGAGNFITPKGETPKPTKNPVRNHSQQLRVQRGTDQDQPETRPEKRGPFCGAVQQCSSELVC